MPALRAVGLDSCASNLRQLADTAKACTAAVEYKLAPLRDVSPQRYAKHFPNGPHPAPDQTAELCKTVADALELIEAIHAKVVAACVEDEAEKLTQQRGERPSPKDVAHLKARIEGRQ